MALGRAFQQLQRTLQREVIRVADNATRQAALRIVNDLQTQGPYWDGYFYNAWEVQLGDTNIPADQRGAALTDSTKGTHPNRGDFTLSDIPSRAIRYNSAPLVLTIGNRMEYRDIAMDLEPGRIKGGGNETAPQDWYVTYYAGGGMDRAVSTAVKQGINLPGE